MVREDKRGHWPLGRRRNLVDPERLAACLDALRAVLATHSERGRVSVRALASAVGVTDRAVRRWLDGSAQPDVGRLRRVEAWCRRVSR